VFKKEGEIANKPLTNLKFCTAMKILITILVYTTPTIWGGECGWVTPTLVNSNPELTFYLSEDAVPTMTPPDTVEKIIIYFSI